MSGWVKRKWSVGALVCFGFLVIASLTAWAYWPALDAPFVFDDEQNIVDSPAIRWTEISWENVTQLANASRLQERPVANFSFALDHLRAGLDPREFHRTNIIIHLAVGCALWWLCQIYIRVAGRPTGAAHPDPVRTSLSLLPVALFLLHPLNTQAVTYVVQRMTSLAALFVLLSFACYMIGRYRCSQRPRLWFFVALLFWLLAIGSKENAVLLLPVVLVYETCFFRHEWCRRVETMLGGEWNRKWTVTAWAGSFVLVITLVWLAMAVSAGIGLTGDFPGRDYNGLERLMTQSRVQIFYLSQLVWPEPGRLNLDHDFSISRGLLHPQSTLVAILACAALVAASFHLALRHPRYGFPLLAYAIFHSIEAGPVSLDIIYEHRMYLPLTMLVALAATVLVDLRYQRSVVIASFALLALIVFSAWTHERNLTWSNPLEFQRDVATKAPNNARAQHNLALAYFEADRPEDALITVQRAIELQPKDDRPRRLMGQILIELDRAGEAIESYQQALTLRPQVMKSLLGLGTALEAAGLADEAFRHYLAEGTELGRSGSPWKAIPLLEKAVELRGADPEAKNALGSAYMIAGLREQALGQFRAAVTHDPSMFEAWYNLGLVADGLGYKEMALDAYQEFLIRAPRELQQPIIRARERITALSRGLNR
jgi:tetratricopeptide (TPR) repeat protein